MASKDPAVLIYFDKWISSTNGMKAEFRAWYLDLLIYQFDKGFIPNDEDAIAGICRVRPSEYESFKQMLKQVLKQKFKQTEFGWENEVMSDVLKKREYFKDKRALSGNIGVVIKMAKTIKGFTNNYLDKLKDDLYSKSLDEIETYKDKQVLNQVLNQMVKLYIDVNVDIDKKIKEGGVGETIKIDLIQNEKMPIGWANTVSEFVNDYDFKKSVCQFYSAQWNEVEERMVKFIQGVHLKGQFQDIAALKTHFRNHYKKHYINGGFSAKEIKDKNQGALSNGFIEAPKNFDYDTMGKW